MNVSNKSRDFELIFQQYTQKIDWVKQMFKANICFILKVYEI